MLTTDQLTAAFNAAGFDTPEKIAAMLKTQADQAAVKEIELKIEALNAEEAKAREPFNAQRADLVKERAVRAAAIAGL